MNPQNNKYSPHTLYFKRHKKSKESPYGTSGSNESSNGSRSLNPSKPSFGNDYAMSNSFNTNSRIDSNSSNPSNPSNPSNIAIGGVNLLENIRYTGSDEKHLEPTHREKEPKLAPLPSNVKIIEEYGETKEKPILEQKKPTINKPSQKLQDSMVTGSSPSRGSVLTNPQQPGGRFGSSLNNSNTQETYPLKPGKAIQVFKNVISEYEKGEILNYREIY